LTYQRPTHAEVAAYFNHFARLHIGTRKMLPPVKRQFWAMLWPPGMCVLADFAVWHKKVNVL
jgi:hypothetical protein